MSTVLNVKTHQLVTKYQEMLLLEKEALLACPAAKEAMIDLLLELQKPTRQRRINAQQLARLVTGLSREILSPRQLFTEILKVPISLENWNVVRRAAEHEQGPAYDKWRGLLDDVSQIRNEVLLDYMYLVKRMAYAFSPTDPLLREDFESYSIIGLIRALDSFKTNLAIPFNIHAYNWMLSYVSRMSDRLRTVPPSETAVRILTRYREGKKAFSAKHSRPPSLDEMVEQLDIPVETLVPIIEMARPIASFDASNTEGKTLHELLSDNAGVAPGNDLEDLKKAIRKALSRLNETERLAAVFYLEMNLNDVSAATTYPLAGALHLVKEWARTQLGNLIPGEG